jgi:hypothetical protein
MPVLSGYGAGGYGEGGYGIGVSGPVQSLDISYYLNLLTSEYQQSTKWLAWLQGPLQILDDASRCISTLDAAFDLDVAIGVQLDYLGIAIGQSRTVGFQPSAGVSPVLNDDTYRILLKSRVAQNQWDGKVGSLQGTWQQLFPGGRIIIDDTQDMAATIILSGAFTSIIQDLIVNGYIVPRPEGVEYNYTFPTLPIFGLDQNTAFVAGVDLGHIT